MERLIEKFKYDENNDHIMIDSYEKNGYTVRLMDDYTIQCINPCGKFLKNVSSNCKKHKKWKTFLMLRRRYRKTLTELKKRLGFTRKIDVNQVVSDHQYLKTKVTHSTVYNLFKDRYVDSIAGKGFLDWHDDGYICVNNRRVSSFKLLHPCDIDDVDAVIKQAVKELRVNNLEYLLMPVYDVEYDEINSIRRFAGTLVDSKKLFAVMKSYGWVFSRYAHGKCFKQADSFKVLFEYSVDFAKKKKEWTCGEVFFEINRETVPVEEVPQDLFSMILFEIDKSLAVARIDDLVSIGMLESRQNLMRMYINALNINNAEVIGKAVKIYGDWGIYGVSLEDARSFWWSNKRYICIQPVHGDGNSEHGVAPVDGAYMSGDGMLEDPVLALAISKVLDLSDDTHPIDEVEGRQIRPYRSDTSNDGTPLKEVEKQRILFQSGLKNAGIEEAIRETRST